MSEDRAGALSEAYKRGLLPPEMKGAYEEALKRGLMGGTAATVKPSPLSPEGEQARRREGMIHPQTENLPGGQMPAVDYRGGTGFLDRMALKQADNDKERRLYLSQTYGDQNVFQDPAGTFYVRTKEGKLVAPGGGDLGGGMVSSLAAHAPEIVGGTIGAAIGGVPGAAVGTGLGKTLSEAGKVVGGRSATTLGEKAQAIGLEGVTEGAGQKAGEMFTGIPGFAGRLYRKFITGTTPEARELTGQTLRSGLTPPIISVAPSAKRLQWQQLYSQKIVGSFTEQKNLQAIESRMHDVLAKGGFSQPERVAVMGQILDPTTALSSREAGGVVQEEITRRVTEAEREITALGAQADQTLTQQLAGLSAITRRAPPGTLGADVATGIKQARKDFSTAMQKGYDRVNQLIGGQPVVPAGLIKREAAKIVESLPKDKDGNIIFGDPAVLRSLQQLRGLGAKITLSDAQKIRSTLADFGEVTNLTPGVNIRQFEQLRAAADSAIGQAGRDPVAAPAVNLLRQMDQRYGEGIRKFQDTTVNQMVKQAKGGIVPDPNKIAQQVLDPNFTARATEIKRMVGDRVWRRVAAADFQAMKTQATDPVTGELRVTTLARLIRDRDKNGLLEITYGPGLARDLRQYTQRLAVRDGRVPSTTLTPDSFQAVMANLEKRQTDLDTFMQKNYLSALAQPGRHYDDAVRYIVQPREEAKLMQAQRLFGDQSPAMEAIRKQALKELLKRATVPTESGANRTVSGDEIEKALSSFTARQQAI